MKSLDDYLLVLDRFFRRRKPQAHACLKTTLANERTLEFQNGRRNAPGKLSAFPATSSKPESERILRTTSCGDCRS
jgi:hypothetical protein